MIRLHFCSAIHIDLLNSLFLFLLKSCAEVLELLLLLSWKEQEEVSSSLGNSSHMIDTMVSLAVDSKQSSQYTFCSTLEFSG